MSDLLTTLHPINDDTTDLYPNIKRNNLPQEVKDELDSIPDKVDKVPGKGLSTNDFTNEDKLALETTIPNALNGKVDKVSGKGLSTNDFTNADKAYLDNLPTYFISLAKGGMADIADADMPSSASTPYFGAKHGTTSFMRVSEQSAGIKVTTAQYSSFTNMALTGSGGFTTTFSRDGTINVLVLTKSDFKVTADSVGVTLHHKTILDVSADNGFSVTDVSGSEEKKVTLQFHEIVQNNDEITTNSAWVSDPDIHAYIENSEAELVPYNDLACFAYYAREGSHLRGRLHYRNKGESEVYPYVKLEIPFDCWNNKACGIDLDEDGTVVCFGITSCEQFIVLNNGTIEIQGRQNVSILANESEEGILTFSFDESVGSDVEGFLDFDIFLLEGR